VARKRARWKTHQGRIAASRLVFIDETWVKTNMAPLNVLPPRKIRFGSPLILSRIHWVEPKLVAEITYLTWTADGLLRHTVYIGLREDKPADQVRREVSRHNAGRSAHALVYFTCAPSPAHLRRNSRFLRVVPALRQSIRRWKRA
jgi:ATP dependent DNA ligase C terminal region